MLSRFMSCPAVLLFKRMGYLQHTSAAMSVLHLTLYSSEEHRMSQRKAAHKHNMLPLDCIKILSSAQEAADWYYHSDYTELNLTQAHYLPAVT